MPGNAVKHRYSDQNQTGTNQTHDHIFGRSHQSMSGFTDQNQTSCRNRIDLDKHIRRKHIIRVDQRQKRTHHQIYEYIKQILLCLCNVPRDIFSSAGNGQKHDQTKYNRHHAF